MVAARVVIDVQVQERPKLEYQMDVFERGG
jgi:hypothetical protein